MIEYLIVGIIYLPLLIVPAGILIWYAFGSINQEEVESKK